MRWNPYCLTGESGFDDFWRDHLADRERRVLLILGRGFDVRATETARRLAALGANIHARLLAFDNNLAVSPEQDELTRRNHEALVELLGENAVQEVPVQIGGPSGPAVTPRNTQRAIAGAGDLLEFDDVVVDISAMPRMVALTAVAKLLFDLDEAQLSGGRSVNLHVTTAESVTADLGAARGSLRDSVTMVTGFSGQLNAQGTEQWPRVWFPVLGEGQRERLDLIRDLLNPDEICPVIPFPSKEPRRGDEIVAEHRMTLFDDFAVEPANLLLASEYNPFEAYKQLFLAMDRYRRALKELGGCKVFVSPLSSKLLSIGVLLACYDHRFGDIPGQRLDVGIPYVETADYGDPTQDIGTDFELYSMWIRGEWEEDGGPAADASAG
jgi:hypothetical protein